MGYKRLQFATFLKADGRSKNATLTAPGLETSWP